MRTRVLRDQLGLKLAKQAGVNFDTPETAVEPPPPERKKSASSTAMIVVAIALRRIEVITSFTPR